MDGYESLLLLRNVINSSYLPFLTLLSISFAACVFKATLALMIFALLLEFTCLVMVACRGKYGDVDCCDKVR